MTPKTIESEFSEILQGQLQQQVSLDLTTSGPPFCYYHPKVLWAKLQYERNPDLQVQDLDISGLKYECFETLLAAQRKYPQIKALYTGRPWSIFQFLTNRSEEAIIDFFDLGTVVVSHSIQSPSRGKGLFDHLLPIWLNYAVSPELWGPVGKWTRFHQRLNDLFMKFNLLKNRSEPGYYELISNADVLEKFGFKGSRIDNMYVLVLPWTFSLTNLEELEKIISQEF